MPKPYTPNDKWSQKAQEEGFRARSVYKLQELQERFHLFRKNQSVLDLGACPGSWLQYVRTQVDGTVIGIDLTPIEPIEGVHLFTEDITDVDKLNTIFTQLNIDEFPIIISDLAPKTSGIADVDQWRSIELSHAVLNVAKQWLTPTGTIVLKILRGADFDELLHDLKHHFEEVRVAIAKASRDRSKEVYVIAREPHGSFFLRENYGEETAEIDTNETDD